MKQHWRKLQAKVDARSLRERGMIFVAIIAVLIVLTNLFLQEPLLLKQKKVTNDIAQNNKKISESNELKEMLLQAKKNGENSPLHKQLNLMKQQNVKNENYLQDLRNHLVSPEKMTHLLQQVLKKEGQLELVSLQSLPVTPLIPKKPEINKIASGVEAENLVYMHPVKITVRGNYLELIQYLTNLEHLPMQMFWQEATMKVVQQSNTELTLTLYTLSFDKTWLQI